MGVQQHDPRMRAREAERRYRAAHPDRLREKDKKWRATHPEENRKLSRDWARKNPAKVKEMHLRYVRENREKVNAANRRWRAANKKRENERVAAWSKANPAKCAIRANRRRTRKAGSGGAHTLAEWIVLCWVSAWRCYYCGGGPLNEKSAVQEHKTPLARGGSDSIENIVVSCRPCNGRKHTMTEAEFMARRQTA